MLNRHWRNKTSQKLFPPPHLRHPSFKASESKESQNDLTLLLNSIASYIIPVHFKQDIKKWYIYADSHCRILLTLKILTDKQYIVFVKKDVRGSGSTFNTYLKLSFNICILNIRWQPATSLEFSNILSSQIKALFRVSGHFQSAYTLGKIQNSYVAHIQSKHEGFYNIKGRI